MKLFKLTLLSSLVLSGAVFAASPENVKAADFVDPNTQKSVAEQSYAFGAGFGVFLRERYSMLEEKNILLSKTDVLQGAMDSFYKSEKFTKEEIQGFNQAIESAIQKIEKADMGQMDTGNKTKGLAFMAENAKKSNVKTTPSGLQYTVITEGSGENPTAKSHVKVHYKGTLIDGTQFDSSYDRGQPAEFPLNGVIKGWTEGLQLMTVGSKYQFVIPSDLGYGSRGNPSIPPGSTLLFDVELLEITK